MRKLAGSLPPSWSQLTDLAELDIGDNYLTGTLPPQYSNLGSMTYLDAQKNELTGMTGSIPREGGDGMASLASFIANTNSLTGVAVISSR